MSEVAERAGQTGSLIASMTMNPDDFSLLLGPDVPSRVFTAGEVIFYEGDRAEAFYVIRHGRVEIRTGNRLLETLGPNEIFGEMALIDSAPRSADAVAKTEATVAVISEKDYLFLVKHTPHFALKVMRVLARRLRVQNKAV
jgi:CRP-like cAMP-binding protein